MNRSTRTIYEVQERLETLHRRRDVLRSIRALAVMTGFVTGGVSSLVVAVQPYSAELARLAATPTVSSAALGIGIATVTTLVGTEATNLYNRHQVKGAHAIQRRLSRQARDDDSRMLDLVGSRQSLTAQLIGSRDTYSPTPAESSIPEQHRTTPSFEDGNSSHSQSAPERPSGRGLI